MTLEESFREEGIKKGIEEGMKKGTVQTLSKTAIKLLTKRFGAIPRELREEIINLDPVTLEVIIDNIFEYERLEDIRKYLQ